MSLEGFLLQLSCDTNAQLFIWTIGIVFAFFRLCPWSRVRSEDALILRVSIQEAEFTVLYEKIGVVGRGTINEAARAPNAVQ